MSEREEQCLEMSQAPVNVLSWRDMVVPPHCTALHGDHSAAGGRAPTTGNMAGLCALVFASGGVVLRFNSSSDLSHLFNSLCVFVSPSYSGASAEKWGNAPLVPSPVGDVVIGQLIEGLLVKSEAAAFWWSRISFRLQRSNRCCGQSGF